MDFFSHAFWTIILYKVTGERTKRRFNLWLAAFWGVFPDLFAFGIPALWFAVNLVSDKIESLESVNFSPIFNLTMRLYSASHSLVVFTLASAILAIFILINRRFSITPRLRQIPWEFGAWLLHILIEITTHSLQFYATPFLWPLSNLRIDGLSWRDPWFLAIDYSLMIIVYFIVFRKSKTTSKVSEVLESSKDS